MVDHRSSPLASPAPTASATEFLATLATILVVIAVLLAADTALARVDRRESAAHAMTLYDDGRSLLAAGHARTAAERFASAVAMERGNARYQLALADALLAERRLTEAEATLMSLLSHAEMDGAVNLAMARVLVREGRPDEAKSHYHRAIYGLWGADSMSARLTTRLELIDLLTKQGAKQELLAELLPLQQVMPDSLPLRERVGQLFISAGSPARGADVFRGVLRQNSADPDAYAGMGEAALALGNFRTARADLLEAVRLAPNASGIAARLALADSVLALNPNERGIGGRERYLRARGILVRTAAMTESCAALASNSAALADSVRQALGAPVRRGQEDVESDRLLAQATALYALLPMSCVDRRTASGEALALIQERLSQ